jgi:hypothetical protein
MEVIKGSAFVNSTVVESQILVRDSSESLHTDSSDRCPSEGVQCVRCYN